MSDSRTDLPSPGAPNFNQRLREAVQTYLGRQGNPLDRGLTLRDLVDTGVLKLRAGFQLKPGSGSSVPLEPGDGVVDTYEPDLTPPPTPGNMTATASISHVMIEHEAPLYRQGHGHLRTRVYGKVVNAGDPLPTFADAAEIGQFSGTIYAQPSNPATTWRLWTKWETVDGVLSVNPAGGINGLEAVTGQDVALLLEALNGQITSSQLYADLGARIDLIDGPATLSGSVSQRIATEQITRSSEIQSERQARASALLAEAQARGNAISIETQSRITADSALQSQINMLSAAGSGDFSELLAAIQEEQTARIDGDTAEATQRTTLAAQVVSLQEVDQYNTQQGDILNHGIDALAIAERIRATAALNEEQTVRATQDEALSQRITTLSATVGQNAATLTAEQTARATADEALSSNLLSLTAKVNTNTASITSEQSARATADSALTTSINYLQAQVNGNAASITSEATARATADSSLSGRIDTLTAAVNTADANLSAAIQTEAAARATAIQAEATARQTLKSTVEANNTTLSAAVQTEASTRSTQTGDLFAKYTVKVDLNGYVSGFGLASTANNSTPTSSFSVRADRFYIASPGGPGVAPSMPFIVQATPATINGVAVPVGVYMHDAFIQNGTITNAKIANLAVDNAKISSLSAEKINAGTLDADRISANSLTANKINTEGLTIKHNGQVILGAGASLPAQFVTPDGGWLNSNLVPSINAAATTATWGSVSGANKPADGATSGSNLVKKSVFSDGNMGSWSGSNICAGCHGGVGEIDVSYRDTLEHGNDFFVTPGETLFAAADVYTGISDYPASAGVMFSNAAGAAIHWAGTRSLEPRRDWTRVFGSFTVPAGAVKATPWLQIDGPGGQVLPYVAFSRIYVGRQQEGATVGAPAGTYVGNTPAQDVESQGGAQGKADIARAGAIGAASEDASNKANWARNAAVSDVTPTINAKLSKAGDTISGRISFAVADGMFAGSDTNNGVYFGKDGLVGRKWGRTNFYINSAGDAVFSGTIDAATMNSGRINLQHNGEWDWGYARSLNKWWNDGQNGWICARHADGSTFMEMRGGSNRIWMSDWNDCGIQFPGITMTNGGLTISQANVINTLNIGPNQVTVPVSAETVSNISVSGLTNILSVTVDAGGSPVWCTVSGKTENDSSNTTQQGSTIFYLEVYLYIDGNLVASSAPSGYFTFSKLISGGGSRTITLAARGRSSGWGSGDSSTKILYAGAALFAIGVKR